MAVESHCLGQEGANGMWMEEILHHLLDGLSGLSGLSYSNLILYTVSWRLHKENYQLLQEFYHHRDDKAMDFRDELEARCVAFSDGFWEEKHSIYPLDPSVNLI